MYEFAIAKYPGLDLPIYDRETPVVDDFQLLGNIHKTDQTRFVRTLRV